MLLLFFNRGGILAGGPIGSTGNGVLCLEASLFTDELEAAVALGAMEVQVGIGELVAQQVGPLTATFSC